MRQAKTLPATETFAAVCAKGLYADFPAFAHAAIADAASLRGRGTVAAALQPKSPERSLKTPLSHEIQTVLSPRVVPTFQSRTKLSFAAAAPMAAFGLGDNILG